MSETRPNASSEIRLWLIGLLLVFLPLSAWLVSFTGNYLVSLGRDLLLGLIVLFSLLDPRTFRRPGWIVWLAIIFVALTLLSYVHRQDAFSQWARGVRYLTEPLLLVGVLWLFPERQDNTFLSWTIIISLLLMLVGGLIDFLRPEILRWSLHAGSRGYLGQIHLASTLPRLQATLAGPNALGLYLLVLLLLAPLWYRLIPRWLTTVLLLGGVTGLILTFSRSSYVGLVVGWIAFLVAGYRQIKGAGKWLGLTLGLVVLLFGFVVIAKPEQLTRFNSNEIRLEQYQRIWRDRTQIGLFGRGAGTAGLVSEFSFDNSPNYFTENTYLNIYENIGIFGMLVYLIFWLTIVASLWRQRSIESTAVAAATVGLLVAGLFIDHYTGQAAIWTLAIIAAVRFAKPTVFYNR